MNNRQQLLFFSLFLSACSNNEKPHCDITDPISSSAYLLGQNILFQARSSDNEQNNHNLSVAWESDLDGVFNTTPPNTEGEIGFVYNGLSAGNHTITLKVEDDRGALYADSVLLTVRTAPLIDILSPENGSLHGLNASVPFKVNVEDPEDLSQEISLLWESSIDGEFSNQGPDANGDVEFSFRDFSPGVHNIRVTATDTTGLTDSAYINIRINTPPTAPQVEISPQEPSTNESLSANVFGSVDADGEEINYQYQWLKNGNPTSFASTSIHASATSVGDVWTLRATPSDGYTEGQYGEASVIVTNTKPSISNVRIAPIDANNDTIVTCNATASDTDQEVSPTYRWLIGDLSYAGAVLDLSTTSARPGEVVTCIANVTDDEGAFAESSASITLQNREPLISDITISPSEIYTGTQVNCAAAAMDPDEGPLLPTYRWTLGNQVLSTSSGYAVQASETNVGEELTCTVTATDSAGLIASNSASVTIENTIPAITDIQITPNGTVYNDSSVTCVANAVDPDEPLSVNYEWKQNGNPIKTGSILDLSVYSIHPADHIECIASVTDASGAFVAANVSINVDNRPPVVDYVALSDAKPKADALIECIATVSDPDGEALLPTYKWTRNGIDIGGSASLQLDPSIATVGAPLTCTALVTDAAGASANASASATIDNTEPTMGPVAIQPESNLHVNSELTCSATGYDFNDGTLTPTYTWTNTTNGLVVGNAQTLQLDPSFVNASDIIECTVTFTDNDGASVQDRFSVEVLNGSPSFDSAAEITPNTMVKTGTTVVCSANATDPEEGALSPTYTWSLGAQILSTTNTYTVSALETDVGDQLTCTASVNDDTGETATTTAHVTVENTEPIIDFISLSSSEVYNDDPLECIATVVDPDELQPLTISYEWSIASALIGSGTSLDLASTTSNPGSTVVCTATTTDSQGATTSSTAEASITNRLPTAPSVSISPETPTAGQDPLVCTIDVESTDEDGDLITYSYEWLREGVVFPNYTTSILPPSAIQSGETWTCIATPFDGLNNGDSARDSVVISTCVLSECDMSLDLGDGVGVDFVEIPAGNFTMGSPTSEIGRSNDEVEHLVTLSNPFYMMTTEVTQGMFEQLSGYNPATYDTTYGIDTNYPVYYVNWHMAADFSNKMTVQHNQTHGTSLAECYTCSGSGETVSCDVAIDPYSCDGYRLPTESEWEYSARAGTTKAIWTPYGGGDLNNTTASLYLLTDGTDLRDQSWYYVNRYDTMYYNTAKPVAQLQENSFGLHDMSGNLWEWTNDWYDYYPTDAQIDPVGPSSGVMRVIRGGFWCNSPYNLRSAKRIRFSPAVRIMSIGFRLVRTQ